MSITIEPITLVEIDVPTCSRTYGVAPCTAALGVTGDIKCFNGIRTCQDREHYDRTVTTLRLVKAGSNGQYDAIPNVLSVSTNPPQLDPGNSMGVRAAVTVTCTEHPHGDSLFDKYVADRGYNPFDRGTFWAKFRARFPSIQGAPLRVLRGNVGDALEDMRTEHYFVTGMTLDGTGVKIQAKDALSFCDPKNAQCPLPSSGQLLAGIDTSDMAFTLTPSGIGDEEYPASGYGCLSNKEVVSFTRSGDAVTIVARNQFGTELDDHDEGAVFQLCKQWTNESVADIVYELLTAFTPGIDASWCDLPAWQAEAEAYIGVSYSALIAAPQSVQTLINELIQQAGVNIWGDPERNSIEFRTLRPVSPGATVYDAPHILQGSTKTKEQPDKRVSLAVTYYGVANVVEKLDKEKNFKAAELTVDPDADTDYDGFPAIKKNFSRWIPVTNRPGAARLNNMQLSRFRDPPRVMAFNLYATHPLPPRLGDGIYLSGFCLQDVEGNLANVPALVTSKTPMEDGDAYEAEELHFADSLVPGSDRSVFIDVDSFNVNLRELYDTVYTSVPEEAVITFYIKAGTWVGGDPSAPSITVGSWPESPELILVVGSDGGASSKLLGGGGAGGADGFPETDGGVALYTRYAITIRNYGVIGGGGGGGQANFGFNTGTSTYFAAGGGGGAGFNGYNDLGGRRGGAGGIGTDPGGDGTDTTGGAGATAGDGFPGANQSGPGGDLAEQGWISNALGPSTQTGTDPGAAIDGVSFVTFDVTGSVVGDQIN